MHKGYVYFLPHAGNGASFLLGCAKYICMKAPVLMAQSSIQVVYYNLFLL